MGYYLETHGDLMQFGAVRRNGARLSGAVGVHTTENLTDFIGPDQNAENVVAYMATRWTTSRTYGSYHIVSDFDSIVDCVRADHEAWHDIFTNNHSLSISMSLQAARWMELEPERRAQIVRMGAKAAYLKCKEAVDMGLLDRMPPAERITGAQAIAGTHAGFYGHGETNPGTRYDPGSHFDWDLFLDTYAALVASGGTDVAGDVVEPKTGFERLQEQIMSWYENQTAYQSDMRRIARLGAVDAAKAIAAEVWGFMITSRWKKSKGKKYSAESFIGVTNAKGHGTEELLLGVVQMLGDLVTRQDLTAEQLRATLSEKLGSLRIQVVELEDEPEEVKK